MLGGKWNVGVKGRLVLLGAIPVVLLTVIGIFSSASIKVLRDASRYANDVRVPLAQATGQMDSQVNALQRFLWSSYSFKHDPQERQKNVGRFKEAMSKFETAKTTYAGLPKPKEAEEIFKRIDVAWAGLIDPLNKVISLLDKGTGNELEAIKDIGLQNLRPGAIEIQKALGDLGELRKTLVKADLERENATAVRATAVNILGVLLSIIITLGFSAYFGGQLTKALLGITERVASSSQQVGSASQQLSSASQQLSAGATETASSLEETSASLEEMTSMVKLNADHAKEAGALSAASRDSAEKGEAEIKQLIASMSQIAQSSKKIEEIINVIDDIAFQTNLLALNAAVEAARAGEQGRGFAVVADAVRELASKSGAAAKDINSLIKESVGQIENGAKIADSSGIALKAIVTSVKKVADLNNEIATASTEQSAGISQITQAVTNLDQATQSNAASAEEAAASSEEMSAQAEVLRGLITELSVLVHGKAEEQQSAHVTAVSVVKRAAPIAVARRRTGGEPSLQKTPLAQQDAAKIIPFEPVKDGEKAEETKAALVSAQNLKGF